MRWGGTVINIHVFFAPTNECAFKKQRSGEESNSLIVSQLLFLSSRTRHSSNVTFLVHLLTDYPLICEFCAGTDSIALSTDSHPSNNISVISICFDYKGH